MKITMHGAGGEVGRSCIEVEHEGKRILLDGGLKIQHTENIFPTKIANIKNIKALFLSHAHMDHSGALPLLFHQGLRSPIITTACTKDITRILLQDSWKIDRIEGRQKIYGKHVLKNVLDNMRLQKNGNVSNIKFRMFPTGHIPSSQAILLEYDKGTLLYSGDINGTDTHLLDGVTTYPKADVLILESTYGDRNHSPRKETERAFVDMVKDTLKNGGTVLCAAFAVGRAQELMILLDKENLNYPIYLDGMSKKVLSVFLKHAYELKDDSLKRAAKRVQTVDGWKMRKNIANKPCVIIATAGMLDAGPVLGYLKQLYKNKKNAVIMTGYQAEGSNGRLLLQTGDIDLDGSLVRVECQIQHFELSAHACMDDLHKIIDSVQPKHLVLNHGDIGPETALANYAKAKGIKTYAPLTGSSIDIEL